MMEFIKSWGVQILLLLVFLAVMVRLAPKFDWVRGKLGLRGFGGMSFGGNKRARNAKIDGVKARSLLADAPEGSAVIKDSEAKQDAIAKAGGTRSPKG